MSDKTRNIIEKIVVPAALGLALVITSIWGASQAALAKSYQISTTNSYSHAFSELSATFNDLENTLSKLMVTSSPARYVLLLDDVWRLSGTGVGLMAQIPQSHLDTVEINRFVVQLGDYAHSLTKKAVQGTPLTEEDTNQLRTLYDACVRVSDEIDRRLESGDIPTAVITNDQYFSTQAAGAETENQGGTDTVGGEEEQSGNQGEGSENAQPKEDEESITEFPTLIYDGPFSDSAEKLEPKGLTGEQVDEAKALSIATEATGGTLEPDGLSQGTIPSFDFSGQTQDGRMLEVSVTQTGGHILWMMSSASGGAEGKPEQGEAERFRDAALQYLREQDFGEMVATYAQYYGGCALINCAAKQDDVILYSDLVKVWVDRETLQIIGVDARNYFFSHVQRDIPQPEISMEEAEAMVSDSLTIDDRKLALIPLTPQTERLCYEFKGTYAGNSYIVYINAKNGEEEQIFRIIDSEDGQLVI